MADHSSPPSSVPPSLKRPRAEAAEQLIRRIAAGKEIQGRAIQSVADLDAHSVDATKWKEYNCDLLKSLFTTESISQEYRWAIPAFVITRDHRLNFKNIQQAVTRQIEKLESVLERLDLYSGSEAEIISSLGTGRALDQSKVFVVHGHDEGALQAVARFLESLELDAIVLREQPDQGRTIIEKFEHHANEVAFAVILLTPDDIGGAAIAEQQSARARQNVVFELGYFVGKLGRGRVCLLEKGKVEIPSDLYGVIYSELDTAEGWKLKLVRELKAAKLAFDAGKVWD